MRVLSWQHIRGMGPALPYPGAARELLWQRVQASCTAQPHCKLNQHISSCARHRKLGILLVASLEVRGSIDTTSKRGPYLTCTPRLQKPALSWRVWSRPACPAGATKDCLHFKVLHGLSGHPGELGILSKQTVGGWVTAFFSRPSRAQSSLGSQHSGCVVGNRQRWLRGGFRLQAAELSDGGFAHTGRSLMGSVTETKPSISKASGSGRNSA